MCRFCDSSNNEGGSAIFRQGDRQTIIPFCPPCYAKFEAHGIVICQKCGNLYLRNSGNYIIEDLVDCERCHVNVVPFALRNGNGATA